MSVKTLRALLERRLSRRRLFESGCELAVLSLAARSAWSSEAAGEPRFGRVAPSKRDAVIVPDGYRADVVLRWGDPLVADAPRLDAARVAAGSLLEPTAAAEQERQFGYNCDGLGIFEGDGRTLLCVNHEFPSPELMFPGWAEARAARGLAEFVRARPQTVAYMQAAVGLSVVELERGRAFSYSARSRYNRRITANTPIEISGPARDHPLLNPRRDATPVALGTFGNCAAGMTPWGTYVTAEENVDDYFGNGAAATVPPAAAAVHRRFGFRQRDSAHRWEYADPRFDAAVNPNESLKFGWIVELDPFDPGRPPKKRTALGRIKHESATTTLARDGRAVVYIGDDQQFEYLYKFVSADRFNPRRREANFDLLDAGTLYVAKFFEDGTGEWLPLVFGEHPELTPARGFASQGDVALRCREAADRLGATPLDRPEDVAINPRTQNVYVACTQNSEPRRRCGRSRWQNHRYGHEYREPARAERGGPHSRDRGRRRRRGCYGVPLGDLLARRRPDGRPAGRRAARAPRRIARRGRHVFRRRERCRGAQRVRQSGQPRVRRGRQSLDRHGRRATERHQQRLLRLPDRGARARRARSSS